MTKSKKMTIKNLKVLSFVTSMDTPQLRGGECSDICFYDPSCAGAGCGAGVGDTVWGH